MTSEAFQVPLARQGGREMAVPRPYVTEPFRQLNSYIYNSILVISCIWYVQVCLSVVHIK